MFDRGTSEGGGTYDFDYPEDEGIYDFDYPEEFGQLAIGVPVNADRLTVMLSSRAFNEQALKDSGLLTDMERSGKAELHVWAGASDNKKQDTSGWNVSASADLNFGFADFAAKFYVKETKNACKQSAYATLAGMSLKENALQMLLHAGTPTQFFNCTTEAFRNCFQTLSDAIKKAEKCSEALSKATNPADKAAAKSHLDDANAALDVALQNFYDRYGTGFVSGLKLRAYGIVQASWERQTSSDARDFVIGGGVGASLPFIGFNAAGEYVETHLDQNLKTTVEVNAFGQPPESPQYKWAADKANAINTPKDIDDFLKGGAWSQDAATRVAEPAKPDIEKKGKAPDQFTLPELPGVPGIFLDAIKRLQSKLLQNVKDESGGTPDPAAVVSAKQETLMKVARGEKKLVEAAGKTEINDAGAGKAAGAGKDDTGLETAGMGTTGIAAGDADAGNDSGEASPAPADGPTRRGLAAAAAGGRRPREARLRLTPPAAGVPPANGRSDKTSLDLGGYVPFGYYYKPWEEIFPELNLALPCTPAQLLFGKSLVWYSKCDMFAQYLEFCGHFYGVSRDKDGNIVDVSVDASAFRIALDEVSANMTTQLQKAEGKTDFDFVDNLDKKLLKRLRDDVNFTLLDHYQFWLDNYHWLKQAPFGVVAVIQRVVDKDKQPQYYYQENPYPNNPMRDSAQPEGCALATNLSPAKLIRFSKAYRLYPIISTARNGEPHFAWVGAPSPLKSLPNDDYEDNQFRYSGLMSFTDDPRQHLSFRPEEPPPPPAPPWGPDNEGRYRQPFGRNEPFSEVAVPMLIHQSQDAAKEMKEAVDILGGRLNERWNNRKRVFGMHLNPGVGDQDPFGHEFREVTIPPPPFVPWQIRREIHDIREGATERLLDRAGQLAHEATQYATVMPDVPKQDLPEGDNEPTSDEPSKQNTKMWNLKPLKGVFGACYKYSQDESQKEAMFFWGPQGESEGKKAPGWDIEGFEPCDVKFIPIDYPDVHVAFHARAGSGPARKQPWARAGGGAMWRQPRTDQLTQRVKNLADTTKEDHEEPKPHE